MSNQDQTITARIVSPKAVTTVELKVGTLVKDELARMNIPTGNVSIDGITISDDREVAATDAGATVASLPSSKVSGN